MTIFNFLSLIGGLALFLFGMNVMGSGLEKMGGGKFESVLEKMTNNRIKGVLLGAGVTIQVDQNKPRAYPFTFCASIGCVARLGFTHAVVPASPQGLSSIPDGFRVREVTSLVEALQIFFPPS